MELIPIVMLYTGLNGLNFVGGVVVQSKSGRGSIRGMHSVVLLSRFVACFSVGDTLETFMDGVLAALRRPVNALAMENAINASGSNTQDKTAILSWILQYHGVLFFGAITAKGSGRRCLLMIPRGYSRELNGIYYGPRLPSATLDTRMAAHRQ
jgi:hypothetical protein